MDQNLDHPVHDNHDDIKPCTEDKFLALTRTAPSQPTSHSNTWTRRCGSGSARAVSSTANAWRSGGAHLRSPTTRSGAVEAAAAAG